MSRAQRYTNLAAVVLPLLGVRRRGRAAVEQGRRLARPRPARRAVRPDRPRHHGRLPPDAHPPRVPDLQDGRADLRGARLDGGAGPGDPLGRRPPQAPRPHRRGGRPALAPRGLAGGGVRGTLRGLLHAHVGWLSHRARPARPRRSTRATWSRIAGCGASADSFHWIVLGSPRDPAAARASRSPAARSRAR